MSRHFSAPTTSIGYVSVFLGALATVQGISSFFDPATAAKTFGIPVAPVAPRAATTGTSGTSRPIPQPHELAHSRTGLTGSIDRTSTYVSVFGARNIAVGINIVVFALTRNDAALGVTFATAALAAALDGYLVAQYGKKGGWVPHTASVAVWGALAATLLG
ncbi:hypothetical protein Q5752_000476 [Cryptotrichosporon argae]